MPITLNAFPLKVPDLELVACQIPYDKQMLDGLRTDYRLTHTFRRQGESIQIFSGDGQFPVSGAIQTVVLKDNLGVFCFLVKDGLIRHLAEIDRHPLGFTPIELISTKPEDNLLAPIVGDDYPFQICAKYTIDTRFVQEHPYLIIDCTTRRVLKETCLFFLRAEFDLLGRYVVTENEDGYRKLLGSVSAIKGETLHVTRPDGQSEQIDAKDAYLEASRGNFDDYIFHTHGAQKDSIVERIRQSVSSFNGGQNKKARIETLKKYIQSKTVTLIDGTRIVIGDAPDIQRQCEQMHKPVFVFNDNGEADWAEKGLKQYGPYTKRTFDRHDPSICVICAQHDKGRVEQFVRKLLKGISSNKYFSNGLEGKFTLGTSRVEVFVTTTDSVEAYKNAIETAVRKKADDGGRWDLALVQVRQSFKKLKVTENPYYLGKSLFFLHQVPVQDFTIELLGQSDYSLGYSLTEVSRFWRGMYIRKC